MDDIDSEIEEDIMENINVAEPNITEEFLIPGQESCEFVSKFDENIKLKIEEDSLLSPGQITLQIHDTSELSIESTPVLVRNLISISPIIELKSDRILRKPIKMAAPMHLIQGRTQSKGYKGLDQGKYFAFLNQDGDHWKILEDKPEVKNDIACLKLKLSYSKVSILIVESMGTDRTDNLCDTANLIHRTVHFYTLALLVGLHKDNPRNAMIKSCPPDRQAEGREAMKKYGYDIIPDTTENNILAVRGYQAVELSFGSNDDVTLVGDDDIRTVNFDIDDTGFEFIVLFKTKKHKNRNNTDYKGRLQYNIAGSETTAYIAEIVIPVK